jgi:5-methylcytosine-specific restriction endonuclease McrA
MSRNPYYIKMISSKEWKRLRLMKLRNNPLCEQCKSNGVVVPATEVHHIIPVESVVSESQMCALMFQYNNLMSLCHACHSDIHRRMFSHSKEAVKANQRRVTESFIDKYLK